MHHSPHNSIVVHDSERRDFISDDDTNDNNVGSSDFSDGANVAVND
jgi:hypothetical protein